MNRRRLLLLLGFGGPALLLIGVIAWVSLVDPTAGTPLTEPGDALPTARWLGPTRAPAQCPEFYGRGPELFDLPTVIDGTSLDAKELGREVVQLGRQRIAVRKISFVSYEMDECRPKKVRLQGILAMPVTAEKSRSNRLVGVVRAHGLLPHEDQRDAVELAAGLKSAVFAVIGPGFKPSGGWDSRPDHFFDTATDPRRSWLWAQSMAVMRGLTYLEGRPEIDPERLGVVGYSSGAMAALIVAGTDPRVKATVAWSGTGFLDLSVQATPVPGWHVALLQDMNPPRTTDSKEWKAMLQTLDPSNFLASVKAPVMLMNGTQDQYFPINATAKTYETLNAHSEGHRLYLIAGYDHGPIADRVIDGLRPSIVSNIVYWFAHNLRSQEAYRGEAPEPEVVSITPVECCPPAGCTVCSQVEIDLPRSTNYRVVEIELEWSTDAARSFIGHSAKPAGGLSYVVTVPGLSPDELKKTVYFPEAVYRPAGQVRRIRVSGVPHLPKGFVPRIWPDARAAP